MYIVDIITIFKYYGAKTKITFPTCFINIILLQNVLLPTSKRLFTVEASTEDLTNNIIEGS